MSFGGSGGGSGSISGSSDVALSNPANNQVLTYNGTLGKWQNAAASPGEVTSVAGRTGAVVLAAADVSGVLSASNNLSDVASATTARTNLGLGNVDNTSDASKPISSATQTALNAKANTSSLATVATTGSYADLISKPSLATVATTGSYNDLTNKPTIPTVTGVNTGDQTLSLAGQSLTISGANGNTVTLPNASGASDATTTAKGVVQLAGDLAGTAASPTVPGLSGKEPTVTAGTTTQYYRGDKTWQTLDKSAVGLANVDNTSDASKPISTATQTALSAKEPTITAGTTGQYWRGDKSWQTLDKTAVGLGNVDNTSDISKPISSATQTALDGKMSNNLTVTTNPGTSNVGYWGKLNIQYGTTANNDPEPILVSSNTSGTLYRTFWLNENGMPRAAASKPGDGVKFYGYQGGGQSFDILSVMDKWTTQNVLWSIDKNGLPRLGVDRVLGAHTITVAAGTAVPANVPDGTLWIEYTP